MKVLVGGLATILLVPILALGAVGQDLPATGATSVSHELGEPGAAVLSHPGIGLSSSARRDVEVGIVDSRILKLLLIVTEHHELTRVGPFKTGHSYYVRGTSRISNHSFGRAVDIAAIDEEPVSASNFSAYEAVKLILSLPSPLRPDEVGSPWRIPAPGSFSDGGHRDHIHVGWEEGQ